MDFFPLKKFGTISPKRKQAVAESLYLSDSWRWWKYQKEAEEQNNIMTFFVPLLWLEHVGPFSFYWFIFLFWYSVSYLLVCLFNWGVLISIQTSVATWPLFVVCLDGTSDDSDVCLCRLEVLHRVVELLPHRCVHRPSFCSSSHHLIHLFTGRIVGAPQMISQPLSSIFPVLHCPLDLANSRPVHSLMLSSHLLPCLPCLLLPFTVPCNMVLARPDEL